MWEPPENPGPCFDLHFGESVITLLELRIQKKSEKQPQKMGPEVGSVFGASEFAYSMGSEMVHFGACILVLEPLF